MFEESKQMAMQWLQGLDPSLVPELPTLLRGAEATKPADVFARLNLNGDDVLTLEEIMKARIPEADALNFSLSDLLAPFAFSPELGFDPASIPGVTLDEMRECVAGSTADVDADGIIDSFEKLLIAATGRAALLSDLNPDTDLASFGLFSEDHAAAIIAADLSKMHQFGLYTEGTLGDLFGGPLFAVDQNRNTISVGLQLEKSETLNGPFESVANPFVYSEELAGKAFYRFRASPTPQ
jgi:hypothetical protein